MATATATSNQLTPAQINGMARALIHQKAIRMQQQIFAQGGIDPTMTPIVTVIPRNVGLVLGFYVNVQGTVNNTGASGPALTPTDFGPANLVSTFSFNDLENNNRINTPGWHVALINSITARRIYGSSLVATTGEDSPLGYGNVYNPITAPSVPFGTSATYSYWYWVPLSYSESDLRGSVYANVVNATMQLNIAINNHAIAASPSPDITYVATGNIGTLTNMSITVHQVYLDQLPKGSNGGVILPILDLATVYELKNTTYTNISANQEYPVNYSNFRDFLSTIAIYYNGTGRLPGTDVNYWALQSANFTNIWKMPPALISIRTRNHLGADVPKGCYYFGSRNKPIATVQYGNMQVVLNALTAGPTATLFLAYEDFALKNAVTQAGSIGGV